MVKPNELGCAVPGWRTARLARSTPPVATGDFAGVAVRAELADAVTAVPSGASTRTRHRSASPVAEAPRQDERIKPKPRGSGGAARCDRTNRACSRRSSASRRTACTPRGPRGSCGSATPARRGTRTGRTRPGPSRGALPRSAWSRGSRSGRNSTTSSRITAWPSRVNVRNRMSLSRTSQISSTVRTRRIRNCSNGRYHSRSQWVCGTTEKRKPATGSENVRAELRAELRAAVSCDSAVAGSGGRP